MESSQTRRPTTDNYKTTNPKGHKHHGNSDSLPRPEGSSNPQGQPRSSRSQSGRGRHRIRIGASSEGRCTEGRSDVLGQRRREGRSGGPARTGRSRTRGERGRRTGRSQEGTPHGDTSGIRSRQGGTRHGHRRCAEGVGIRLNLQHGGRAVKFATAARLPARSDVRTVPRNRSVLRTG